MGCENRDPIYLPSFLKRGQGRLLNKYGCSYESKIKGRKLSFSNPPLSPFRKVGVKKRPLEKGELTKRPFRKAGVEIETFKILPLFFKEGSGEITE